MRNNGPYDVHVLELCGDLGEPGCKYRAVGHFGTITECDRWIRDVGEYGKVYRTAILFPAVEAVIDDAGTRRVEAVLYARKQEEGV